MLRTIHFRPKGTFTITTHVSKSLRPLYTKPQWLLWIVRINAFVNAFGISDNWGHNPFSSDLLGLLRNLSNLIRTISLATSQHWHYRPIYMYCLRAHVHHHHCHRQGLPFGVFTNTQHWQQCQYWHWRIHYVKKILWQNVTPSGNRTWASHNLWFQVQHYPLYTNLTCAD